VGHSNSQSSDVQITATFHHNWFEGSSSRHPRVRYGQVHVYNNLFDGNTTYGVGSAYGAKVLVEYNYFNAVQLPTDICTYPAKESGESNLQGSVAGYLWATQNVYVNKPAKAKSPYPLTNIQYTKYGGTAGTPLTYADFQPAYDYTVTPAEDVPSVVKAGAGYGKLGYTSAPVEVNNGGIQTNN
jgi:pectate lyase